MPFFRDPAGRVPDGSGQKQRGPEADRNIDKTAGTVYNVRKVSEKYKRGMLL